MTITYNSAYVQTETLNFTFAQQAIIVHFDAQHWVLTAQSIENEIKYTLPMKQTAFSTHAGISPIWGFSLSTGPNNVLSVWKYCQLFTHEQYGEQYVILPIQTDGGANAEKSQKQPFPLRHVDPHLIHQCLGPPHSPPQTTARLVHTFPHNHATKSP